MSLCFFVANTAWAAGIKSALPKGFVYIERVVPNIQTDIRYFTTNNFVGQRVDGYLAPRCILTIKAAEALQKVQADLEPFGLGLKLFDCFGPGTQRTRRPRTGSIQKSTRKICSRRVTLRRLRATAGEAPLI
jgi:D-alanyl-D-alanine dipeptidase